MSRNQRRNKRNRASGHQNANRAQNRDRAVDRSAGAEPRRPSSETKSSRRTTELLVYVGAVLAVVMTALAIDEDAQGRDPFGAETAIRLITYLTIGYVVARGLAKSGSFEDRVEHDTDDHDTDDDDDAPRPVAVGDEGRAEVEGRDDDEGLDVEARELDRPAGTARPAALLDADRRAAGDDGDARP